MKRNIDDILAQLTLEEKASLTAGSDMWSTVAIERLGVPALKMTDGPNGARGAALLGAGSVTAACIPCGSALGATWNVALIERLGAMAGEETRSKACRVLLAPTINLHRSPLGGRNFECYSEDPLLAGRTAAAFVKGVQSRGVAATAKHFVANDAEHERYTMSSVVDERTLRELYLVPFEVAVRDGGVLAIMTGYNRLNGTYCSEHEWLLRTVLKQEWGFDGIVMSDWLSAGDTVDSASHGLDLQMPGPARFFGPPLAEAVQDGRVEQGIVDDQARRMLHVADRVKAWEDPAAEEERSVDLPRHRALAREAACEAAVLLTNDGILPLADTGLSSIAAIGPGWARANLMGGGSAQLRPHYRVAPIEALCERAGAGVEIFHTPGCSIGRSAPPLGRPYVRTPDGEPGFAVELFAGEDPSGPVALRTRYDEASVMFFGSPAPGVAEDQFSIRAVADLRVDATGNHTFTLIQSGRARVSADGRVIIDGVAAPPPAGTHFFGMGSEEVTATLHLEAGTTVRIELEYSSREAFLLRGAVLGYRPPQANDPIAHAAEVAAAAEVAILLVGTNHEWESEGFDRKSMDLPGSQNELVEKVLEANPNTIVLVNAGAPVSMDWAPRAKAVMQVWLGGQEMSGAIADLLFGDAEPAGRMPTTIPLKLEHNPSFGNFPGENGEIVYGERLLVGYRWYDTRSLEVRFPFGHGLSYSSFDIGPPRVEQTEALEFRIEVDVRNTGSRRGAEVVQCYVAPRSARLARPAKELRAFRKIWLEPGQARTVTIDLAPRAFAYWDPGFSELTALTDKLGAVASMLPGGIAKSGRERPGWYVDAGEYDVLIARSAEATDHTITVTIEDEHGPLDSSTDRI